MSKTISEGEGGPVAFDLPWDFSAPVLDLTSHEIVSEWARDETPATETTTTTKKEGTDMGEQPYQRWLRENAEAGTTAVDATEDDALFERFAEQSGLNDLTGRVPGTREAADLSAPTGDEAVETPATAGMGDEAAWRSFVELTGFEETAPAPQTGGTTSDLSEDDEEGSSISDDEMWSAYQAAIGQGS